MEATTMTLIEKNKDLVVRYIAALNAHDTDAAEAMSASDLINHAAIPEAQGAAGLKRILGKLFKAMPDLRMTCEDLIAEGDKVVCRVRVKGTQTGPLEMAVLPLPASGREMATEQIHVFRIADGRVVEHWAGRDDIAMLRQLGHLQAATASSVRVAS
jgi:steroid delta-isomerase-like uncharacterized protein